MIETLTSGNSKSVVRRALEPFRSESAIIVFARMEAMDEDGSYRPFSCRLSNRFGISKLTVLGVAMGESPLLISRDANKYYDLTHCAELRARFLVENAEQRALLLSCNYEELLQLASIDK